MNIPFKLHTYTYELDTIMIPTSVSFTFHIWEVEIKNKTEEGIQRKVKTANGKSKEKLTNEKKNMNRENENEWIDKRNNEL